MRIVLAGAGLLALVAVTLSPLTARRDQAAAASGEETWGVSFSRIVDRIKEAFPDDFGAAEVNADQSSGWIAFAGAVPDGAEDAVGELSGIELRGDLGLSEKEISATVDLLFQSLLETHGSDFRVSVYPVPRDREIVVEYSPSATARISAEAVEESIRSAALSTDLGGFSIRAEAADGIVLEIHQHGARVPTAN
ncbi:hypothetical protein [Microbacterium sp. A93]|uniref:hypothetical protein n=1 Tax=Microbacterium sp. A93 TaxID=3450716 RepID=UPI003F42354B